MGDDRRQSMEDEETLVEINSLFSSGHPTIPLPFDTHRTSHHSSPF